MNISPAVMTVLGQCALAGNSLVLPGQLDRKLYVATNDVLVAAGGKWNKKVGAHVFSGPAEDAMEQILLTGEVCIPQDFGYFPSPSSVVDRLMELAEVEDGMRALEPSAGQGNIVAALHGAGARVNAFELLDANVDALLDQGMARVVNKGDFLASKPSPTYDRVVMNPPFSKQADIQHVTHALEFLRPGGRLVSVMSAGVKYRTDKRTVAFKELLASRSGTVEDVPEGAFKESGTLVRTIIVTMEHAA